MNENHYSYPGMSIKAKYGSKTSQYNEVKNISKRDRDDLSKKKTARGIPVESRCKSDYKKY